MEPVSLVVAYYLVGLAVVLGILCVIGYSKNWKGKED